MIEQTITVTLPELTFYRLKQVTEVNRHSIDEWIAKAIDAVLMAPSQLPVEWATLHLLSDKALWQVARAVLTPTEQQRLHELNHFAGERFLTEAESQEQAILLEGYQRAMIRRSQAMAVLKLRGYAIPHEYHS